MGSHTIFYCDNCRSRIRDADDPVDSDDHFNNLEMQWEVEYLSEPQKDRRIRRHYLFCDPCLAVIEPLIDEVLENNPRRSVSFGAGRV